MVSIAGVRFLPLVAGLPSFVFPIRSEPHVLSIAVYQVFSIPCAVFSSFIRTFVESFFLIIDHEAQHDGRRVDAETPLRGPIGYRKTIRFLKQSVAN